MIGFLTRCAIGVSILCCVSAATAEPIKLKMSFFSSDRSKVYLHAIKPFVTAVNNTGVIEIEPYFSGALGRSQAQQPDLLLEGRADIAFVVPGQNPEMFLDSAAIELPGLFRDTREATLTYSRLTAAGALSGYEPFVVIGAYSGEPNSIHSRKPIRSVGDLKGMRIRSTNQMEAAALSALGAVPVLMALPKTMDAVSSGAIDGATLPPAILFDFGIGRVVTHHFLLRTSAAPLALLMSRKKFDQLPASAKAVIVKHSGEWTANRFLAERSESEVKGLERIRADARRSVVFPSSKDLAVAKRAYDSVVKEWAETRANNRKLLTLVRRKLSTVRSE